MLNNSYSRICVFEHVQWRWALNDRLAPGLIQVVNIIARTSHYESSTMGGAGYIRNDRPAPRLGPAGKKRWPAGSRFELVVCFVCARPGAKPLAPPYNHHTTTIQFTVY